MASHSLPTESEPPHDEEDGLLDLEDAGEEVVAEDEDHPMDSEGEDDDLREEEPEQEIQLQNDSKFYFDIPKDSVFCIAQHPRDPSIVAIGSGDDTAYVFSVSPPTPLLPPSYLSDPSAAHPALSSLAQLSGHTDSINAVIFTLPEGDYLVTGGLDGRLRVHSTPDGNYSLVAEAQEVAEINFLAACPNPAHPNTFALGASDGSVWVYTADAADIAAPLQVIQAYYLHTESCTAGAWTPDGKLLATTSEDGSFYVFDVFGEAAAAASIMSSQTKPLVGLTAEDQRFAVEGGLYTVAIAPSGTFAAVGGAGGMIRVIGLPRLGTTIISSSVQGAKGRTSKGKSAGGGSGSQKPATPTESAATAGQVLASLQVQSDSVETLSFSAPPLSLLAAGSVDSSIVLFDTAHSFAVRRHVRDAHDGHAVVQLAFGQEPGNQHFLTSCGMDGVVRRWDARGGTAASGQGLAREWRGHRGGGEGGGVLGFVHGGAKIVTAGDDAICLVFDESG